MIKMIWENQKNNIIKLFCYLIIVCLLIVSFNFNFHNLFMKESSLVNAQENENLMKVVTNDSYEILGEIERTMPSSFGKYSKEEYPSSMFTLTTDDKEKRENIYNENIEMYEDIESAINENRLKKHVSADGQFYGTISDSEKAIIKKIYVNASVKKNHSLGVYAPAGEVLTVEIDESLINKGLSVIIGYEVEANNIPLEKFLEGSKDRMPLIRKVFDLKTTITKVGTPLGGALYVIVPDSINENFTVTVSGGVDNPVFQLGVNNEKDYKQMMKTPGLIMEFKLPHVRLIMPKVYAKSDDIINALQLWHKMSSLSTYAMNRLGNTLPIAHYYDSYVPVGAAVAYVGANFSILPLSWGTNSLNYSLQMSGGNWGNFHEFNHHFQNGGIGKWGINNPSEVTNNVLTVMSYLLYTDIAMTRSESSAPGSNSSGWNVSTDPYYNFRKVMEVSSNVSSYEDFNTNQLYMYADLMHAFGVDKFMKLIRSSYGLVEGYEVDLMNDVDSFALRASEIFESDLSYYLTNICKMNLKEKTITTIKNMNYEPYLPLYNLYSNGVKGVNTGRTYYLDSDTYIFDFEKYTITPFEYKIKEISKLKYGKLKKNKDGKYSYSNPYCKKDNFTITYTINYEGKEYLKKLDFEIDFSYDKMEIKTYNTNSNNIVDAINNLDKGEMINKSYSNSINFNAVTGVNLAIGEGKLKVENSGNYTFAVYGDDQIRFSLNGHEANTQTFTNTINLNDQRTYFKLYLEKDRFYDYTLYCLNTGGEGNARVVYSFEDEYSFKNVGDNYIYSIRANENNSNKKINDYEIVYDTSNYLIANKYKDLTINKIESITTNANSNDSTVVENMFDGNKNSAYHTSWQSDITKFPHEYIVKFSKKALFDNIKLYFTNNNLYYAVGQYEIYVSEDNKNYRLINEGNNTNNVLDISFDNLKKAKFLKIVVKSNADNQLFTSISEIEVGIKSSMNKLNYYASNNANLHYIDEWNLSYINNHFNGVNSMAKKGSKVEFYFVGNELALYTYLNSKYRIKIDNGSWVNVTTNSKETTPSYIKKNLENKKHKVVIESLNNEVELEMIGINGIIEERNVYSLGFIEFYKIIGSVSIAVLLVQTYLYLVNKKVVSSFIKNIVNKINNKL